MSNRNTINEDNSMQNITGISKRVQAFHWGDIALSQTVFIDKVPHVTRRAIGEWLEYEDEPQDRVRRLIGRHAYIENYSTAVMLTAVDGKNYNTRIYHPIGFSLIVMESGQPRAQSMKVAVAEFVWHFSKPKPITLKNEIELVKVQRSLFYDIGKTKDAFVRQGLTDLLSRVCLTLGQSMPDMKYIGKDANQMDV